MRISFVTGLDVGGNFGRFPACSDGNFCPNCGKEGDDGLAGLEGDDGLSGIDGLVGRC